MKEESTIIGKNINARQLLEYAKDNGYDSVMFELKDNEKHIAVGKFLDAYYEFIQIPIIGDGFIRLSDLEKSFGHDITFDVITKVAFTTGVRLDFMLRGKPIPEKYSFEED